jgi:alpha-tubulin suppressor-like RCC1 family protein
MTRISLLGSSADKPQATPPTPESTEFYIVGSNWGNPGLFSEGDTYYRKPEWLSPVYDTGLGAATITQNNLLFSGNDKTIVMPNGGMRYGYIDSGNNAYVHGFRMDGNGSFHSSLDHNFLTGNVDKMLLGDTQTCILDTSGNVYVLGRNAAYALGTGSTNESDSNLYLNTVTITGCKDIAMIQGENQATTFYVIKNNGELWGWGRNTNWQLGQGNNTTNKESPVQIGGDSDWDKLWPPNAYFAKHMFAQKTNGDLYGWGANNNYEQIGISAGNNSNIKSPTLIENIGASGSTYVKEVAGHNAYTLFLLDNGDIWGCGFWRDKLCLGLGYSSGTAETIVSSPISLNDNLGVSGFDHISVSYSILDPGSSYSGDCNFAIKGDAIYVWGGYGGNSLSFALPMAISKTGNGPLPAIDAYIGSTKVSHDIKDQELQIYTPELFLTGVTFSGIQVHKFSSIGNNPLSVFLSNETGIYYIESMEYNQPYWCVADNNIGESIGASLNSSRNTSITTCGSADYRQYINPPLLRQKDISFDRINYLNPQYEIPFMAFTSGNSLFTCGLANGINTGQYIYNYLDTSGTYVDDHFYTGSNYKLVTTLGSIDPEYVTDVSESSTIYVGNWFVAIIDPDDNNSLKYIGTNYNYIKTKTEYDQSCSMFQSNEFTFDPRHLVTGYDFRYMYDTGLPNNGSYNTGINRIWMNVGVGLVETTDNRLYIKGDLATGLADESPPSPSGSRGQFWEMTNTPYSGGIKDCWVSPNIDSTYSLVPQLAVLDNSGNLWYSTWGTRYYESTQAETKLFNYFITGDVHSAYLSELDECNFVVLNDGKLYTWGHNTGARLLLGDDTDRMLASGLVQVGIDSDWSGVYFAPSHHEFTSQTLTTPSFFYNSTFFSDLGLTIPEIKGDDRHITLLRKTDGSFYFGGLYEGDALGQAPYTGLSYTEATGLPTGCSYVLPINAGFIFVM